DDSIYICVDYDHSKNIFLKRMLEMTAKKAKVIFMTANLAELPLKENSIDYLLDFSGISGYSFENEDFLLNSLDKYLKEEITIIASFIIYDKFGDKNIVDRKYRKNFIYKNIKNKILNLDFEIEKEYKLKKHKVKQEFGKYENFAKIGDEISSYQLKAKRWR
ncbi:MAG: methyltransferase, partial [Bacillota bacterium]